MPEVWMNCYVRMLPRIEAERIRLQMRVLLATNDRTMTDEGIKELERDLNETVEASRPKAGRVTLDFLQRAGVTLEPPRD